MRESMTSASNTPSVPQYPICPRCGEPVRLKNDRHELRFQLVNADAGAPKASTDLHAIFHHRCAATVWTVAHAVWLGQGVTVP